MKQTIIDNIKALTILTVFAFTLSYVIVIATDSTAEYNENQESSYINR